MQTKDEKENEEWRQGAIESSKAIGNAIATMHGLLGADPNVGADANKSNQNKKQNQEEEQTNVSSKSEADNQDGGGVFFPTSPNVFIFRERDNLIHTNIFYSENYIQLDILHGAYKAEHVQINSINIWIPNETFLQSKTLDQKIPYLSKAFAAIVDDIRERVNTRWVNGSLRGSSSMESEFKREFRGLVEMSFPGVTIDFKPRVPTWLPSVIFHNVL